MKWARASKYHEQSGVYLVTAYRVQREKLAWLFQAIRLGSPSVVLLQSESAEKCKAACVADMRG